MPGIRGRLKRIQSYSDELGLNLRKPSDRFKWFVASFLFAKRISSETAKRTFRRFVEEGLVTPRAICNAGWDRLVHVLDSGGYVRYDFSTATNLLATCQLLLDKYGTLEQLHDGARSPRELENLLMEFKGVGPMAVNIFLRELRGIWDKARPKPSRVAIDVGRRLGVKRTEEFESQLVRIGLEFCKKRKCETCPVNQNCIRRAR